MRKENKIPKIKTKRFWTTDKVMNVCIENGFYTCGTCKEYSNMLLLVVKLDPDTESLYIVAKDIVEHSKEQTISNVMYLLERDAVDTFYSIENER